MLGGRFAITPLLRATTFPNAALVLAISQEGARLIEVSADRLAEDITVPGMPVAEAARGVLDRIYAADLVALQETFEERRNNGRGSADLSDLARAAAFGAVETLTVDMDLG